MTNLFKSGRSKDVVKGIDQNMTYNGLTFNVRDSPDRIQITSIDGLADAEIRDSRQALPNRDGEHSTSTLYSGRNITLTGMIRAGNYKFLQDQKEDIKSAFADLSSDKPLVFGD